MSRPVGVVQFQTEPSLCPEFIQRSSSTFPINIKLGSLRPKSLEKLTSCPGDSSVGTNSAKTRKNKKDTSTSTKRLPPDYYTKPVHVFRTIVDKVIHHPQKDPNSVQHTAGLSCRVVQMLQQQKAQTQTHKRQQHIRPTSAFSPKHTTNKQLPKHSPTTVKRPQTATPYTVVVDKDWVVNNDDDNDEGDHHHTMERNNNDDYDVTAQSEGIWSERDFDECNELPEAMQPYSRLPNDNMHTPFLRKAFKTKVHETELRVDADRWQRGIRDTQARKTFLGFETIARFRNWCSGEASTKDIPPARVLQATMEANARRVVQWGENKRRVMKKPRHMERFWTPEKVDPFLSPNDVYH
eukprot:PhF_6_TR13324/c0_g1_i1/m.21112